MQETPMDTASANNNGGDNDNELARLNAVFAMLRRQGPGQIAP